MAEKGLADATSIARVLSQYASKRIIVLGPPSIGKSTMLRHIPGALDMDEILFPQLTPEERGFVSRKPWTLAIGQEVKRLVRAKIKVEPGKPVFATVVLEADLIIYLAINDDLLQKRIASRRERPQTFADVKGIQQMLEKDIRESRIPWIEFKLQEHNQDG